MNAQEGIARRIYARVSSTSNDFFGFMGRMPNEARSIFVERLRIYLIDTINAIDDAEEVPLADPVLPRIVAAHTSISCRLGSITLGGVQ